jgi:hypothetical protein
LSYDNKQKRVKLVSPAGRFSFPKLSEPDYGTKDRPKPNGEYSVKLVLREDDEATQAFIAKLQPMHDEAVKAAEAAFKELKAETRKKLKEVKVNDLFTQLLDKETEEPTGEIELKFAMHASGVSKKTNKKWSRKPALFDAKGVAMVKPPAIWGGTIGKVSFEPRPYFIAGTAAAGLKLNLVAAQIIKLQSGGVALAADCGFGVEDGGYEYVEPTESEAEGSADQDASSGKNEDEDF